MTSVRDQEVGKKNAKIRMLERELTVAREPAVTQAMGETRLPSPVRPFDSGLLMSSSTSSSNSDSDSNNSSEEGSLE